MSPVTRRRTQFFLLSVLSLPLNMWASSPSRAVSFPELNDATLREVVSGNYRIAASYRRRYEFPSRVPHSPLSLRPVHLR